MSRRGFALALLVLAATAVAAPARTSDPEIASPVNK
jgi:hypothetical protein